MYSVRSSSKVMLTTGSEKSLSTILVRIGLSRSTHLEGVVIMHSPLKSTMDRVMGRGFSKLSFIASAVERGGVEE